MGAGAMIMFFVCLFSLGMVGAASVSPARPVKDPVTDYIVKASTVDGREVAQCQGRGICRGTFLVCPTECKNRESVAPGSSACFINCQTCTTSCKHRKLNCQGYGAVCYDPRFIGGDGVMFYFHGKKNADFCIVADKNLHINARFIGKRPEGRTRDFTWVQALGMLFDSHKLSVSAKKVATWNDEVDQLAISFDGQQVAVPEHEGAIWVSPGRKVVIERTAQVNSVHLVIDQLMEVSLEVTPISKEDNRIHKYQIAPGDDCFAHLQMQFHFFNLSGSVDGVLGQTYRPGFKSPVKIGVPMPMMGGADKFFSSSLFSADCKVNQFSPAPTAPNVNPLVVFPRAECRTSNMNGGGLACRR